MLDIILSLLKSDKSDKSDFICAETDCKNYALPDSNYCKDHTRGGNSSESGDIARAIERKIINRVDRDISLPN